MRENRRTSENLASDLTARIRDVRRQVKKMERDIRQYSTLTKCRPVDSKIDIYVQRERTQDFEAISVSVTHSYHLFHSALG
jgi:hypothetical protein